MQNIHKNSITLLEILTESGIYRSQMICTAVIISKSNVIWIKTAVCLSNYSIKYKY